jgi:hypothetical protein
LRSFLTHRIADVRFEWSRWQRWHWKRLAFRETKQSRSVEECRPVLRNQGSLSRKTRSWVRLLLPSSADRWRNFSEIHSVLLALLTGLVALCGADGTVAMKGSKLQGEGDGWYVCSRLVESLLCE